MTLSLGPSRAQTGGKLYVAGEYSVLTPGQTALIQFIPIYMTATVQAATETQLSSDMFDYSVDRQPDPGYALIQASLETLETYLGQPLPHFQLAITGKLEKDGVKYGVGSSGSVVLLTLKALANALALDLSKDNLFKLACYTLLKQGDNGSMGDLACIAYEDLVAYTSFDREKVAEQLKALPLADLLAKDWGYTIKPCHSRLKAQFLVGWTKQAAISKDMVTMAKSRITTSYLQTTQMAVESALRALEKGDKNSFKQALQTVSDQLETLSPAIYVDKLKALKQAEAGLDVIAKSSGAGGGDCGIAFAFDKKSQEELIYRWHKAGIEVLYQKMKEKNN